MTHVASGVGVLKRVLLSSRDALISPALINEISKKLVEYCARYG